MKIVKVQVQVDLPIMEILVITGTVVQGVSISVTGAMIVVGDTTEVNVARQPMTVSLITGVHTVACGIMDSTIAVRDSINKVKQVTTPRDNKEAILIVGMVEAITTII